MNDLYWISSGAEQKGPYTLSQLQSMWRTGSITADALYFQQGFHQWEPISLITDVLEPQAHSPAVPSAYQPPNTPLPRRPTEPPKNPGVAAVLSFFIPGLGQIYNGQIGMGILLLFLTAALYFTIFLGIILHLYLIYDAYTTATKMNKSRV